jgi:hypothetical protein
MVSRGTGKTTRFAAAAVVGGSMSSEVLTVPSFALLKRSNAVRTSSGNENRRESVVCRWRWSTLLSLGFKR